MEHAPRISDDPLYQLLRHGQIGEFNRRRAEAESTNLAGCNFRGLDLRGMDAGGLDLSGGYFRQADLRGVDLRDCRLEGASMHSAHISGTWFPTDISAEEIRLALEHGTRLRHGC